MTYAPKSKSGLRLSLALLVIVAGFVAYANTFDGNWVWDDASSVLLHKHVQDPSQLLQLFREDQHAFGAGEGNFYRPLLSVSFMLDYLLSYSPESDAAPGASHPNLKPFVFHFSSLLWHIAAALLLMAILNRVNAPVFVCALVPIIYVLHPLHTEAVSYISGRADMMSATFMFAGLFLALSSAPAPKIYLSYLGVGICFILGLCSKESTMIFPLILALFVFLSLKKTKTTTESELPEQQSLLIRAMPLLLCLLILGIYIFLRSTVLHFADTAAPASSGFGQRLTESAQAFTLYIQALFYPTHLHMERTLAGVPTWYALIGSLLIATCIAIAFIAHQAGQRRITIGMSWFLLAWLPISGLFPLNAPLAEHWMYVPMAGFWWALAELVNLLIQRVPSLKSVTLAAACSLCLVLLATSVSRNQDWDSDKSLFQATIKENPQTRRVHFNLAVTYEDILENPAGARRHFEETLRLFQEEKIKAGQESHYYTPDELEVHLSLGSVNERLGNFQEAAQHYALVTAGRNNPMLEQMVTRANFGLGRCMLALGETNGASRYLQEAVAKEQALTYEVEKLLLGAPLGTP